MCGLEKGTGGGIFMYRISDLGAESLYPDLWTENKNRQILHEEGYTRNQSSASVTGGGEEWYFSYLTLK